MADDVVARLNAALRDHYLIEDKIGEGGMATVYLAEDLKHERKVALKVLKPDLAAVLGAERFLAEIRVTANLQHPHILPLFDSGAADGFVYFVMPFVDGESLRERLDREKRLPVDEAVEITKLIASGLAAAHREGVIHRDIKPENVLLRDGQPILTDFGIALAVTAAGQSRLTETGLSLGTTEYMSPEQATADHELDARTDIYSLACVLYELLTGEPPITGRSSQAIVAKLLTEKPVRPRTLRDTIPEAVEAALMRALEKTPADRFKTVDEFVAALSGGAPALAAGTAGTGAGARRQWVVPVAAMGGIAAALVVWQVAGSGPDVPSLARATHSQLTTEPGVEWFPSLSPDGEWVVYAGQGTGNWDIYLRSVGGQNPINLTESSLEDDDQPAFSPDGQRIAFRSERGGGGIFVMGRTGEAARRVTRQGYKPTWSPDGTQLAYATESVEMNPQNADGRSELWIVGVDSGEERRMDVPDAALPSWSPNGHRIAYTGRIANRGIWTVPAEGGEPVLVVGRVSADSAVTDWNPAWSPDGSHIYFASDRSGSMNLWRIRIDERSGETRGEPEPITTPAVSLAHISLSGDGRRIAYSSALVTSNIQGLGFDPETLSVVGEPRWVTTGSRRWSSPDPSPDGEWIVFYSLVVPEGDVHVIRSDGTELRRVTGDEAIDRVPRWSPDGEWLAFFSNRSAPVEIWKVRPDGSELTQLTTRSGAVPVWSPDGSRMLATTRGDGPSYRFVFDPDGPMVSEGTDRLPDPPVGSFTPNSWSPDGEFLAGDDVRKDEGIILQSVRTGEFERLTDFGQWPVWLPDGRHLMFVSGGRAFYVVDRITKEVREVFRVDWDVIGPPGLTADATMMYFSRRVDQADLRLVTLQ